MLRSRPASVGYLRGSVHRCASPWGKCQQQAPVYGELLFKPIRVADIARGKEISTGMGCGQHANCRCWDRAQLYGQLNAAFDILAA